MYKNVLKEIKSLERITKKTDLREYYRKCCNILEEDTHMTQFEHELNESIEKYMLIDFVKDYAYFSEDNSELLKDEAMKKEMMKYYRL